MSLFITGLAFAQSPVLQSAEAGIRAWVRSFRADAGR